MEKPPEGQSKEDYNEKTKDAEAQFNYHQTLENLNNPPSLREMQEKRLKEAEDDRKAANKRAQDLEDQRLQRIQEESDATAAEAQHQKELREKAEADLRTQRDGMILDELKRLQGLQVNPQQKIEEYFSFNEMLEKRFGKADKPPTEAPIAVDSHLAFELKKMEIGLEQWKIEMGFKRDDMQHQRELDKERRADEKELKKEELELKRGQQTMISSLPKVVADTIAAGIMARATGGVGTDMGSISANPAEANVSHFEAVEGEAGELDCPKCGTKVGVGPTTTQTVCAKCGRQFVIKRVPVPAQEQKSASSLTEGKIL